MREIYIRELPSQNLRLIDLCLTYLAFDCLKFDLGEDEVQQSVLNGDYSFLEYAANNWLNHLRDLDLDSCCLHSERDSDIHRKTKAVLDFHQRSKAQGYTPTDIARYFRAFAGYPEIYNHPALMHETGLGQGSSEGLSQYIYCRTMDLTHARIRGTLQRSRGCRFVAPALPGKLSASTGKEDSGKNHCIL